MHRRQNSIDEAHACTPMHVCIKVDARHLVARSSEQLLGTVLELVKVTNVRGICLAYRIISIHNV